MKTILVSAYAVNPAKGSEDGMGWNFIRQIAANHKVHAVTRRNNRASIERFMTEHPLPQDVNITFHYFDLPAWTRFWKKGPLLSLVYFYMWQFFLPLFVRRTRIAFEIAHNLNFHNDWTPSFLWLLGKPLVWGPVGHHPLIPRNYLLPSYGWRALTADRFRWVLKKLFWSFDPFLRITAMKSRVILSMNSSVKSHLYFNVSKEVICSSVASEAVIKKKTVGSEGLKVLSVGRFVALKGFDITIRSFARFYHAADAAVQSTLHLTLVGDGPEKKRLLKLVEETGISGSVTFIPWIERSALKQLYLESDVFLFPSHEGAGMVVAEALSYGLPVLCFDNEGPGEFVNSACGIRVPYSTPEKSVVQFADGLRSLLNDRSLLNAMSQYARITFNGKYDWNVKGKLLRDVYRSCSDGTVHCVQLMNDFSGSPLVLSNVIKGFLRKGRKVEVYYASSTPDGFLSNLDVKANTYWYRFFKNKFVRLAALSFSQLVLFIRIFARVRRQDTVYVNTLLPFGAAIAGKLRGARVIYHLHETSIQPLVLKRFLKRIVALTASNEIYVSQFLREAEETRKGRGVVVYNAIGEEFLRHSRQHEYDPFADRQFTVLMLCSLKGYKGVDEFVKLAERIPHVRFELVLNAKLRDIRDYFKGTALPANLVLHPQQKNVHPFYRRAHLVVNLSHPDKWIETFGMTILESMSYGIPEIVPNIGGPVELVDDGWNGFRIMAHELDRLEKTIRQLEANRSHCLRLSVRARSKAELFSIDRMHQQVYEIISSMN